jgi:hypothetical protein
MAKRNKSRRSGQLARVSEDEAETDTSGRRRGARFRSRKRKPRFDPHPPTKLDKEKPVKEKTLIEQRFDKAFLLSLGVIALLTLTIFIPVFGPLMVATLVPYLACSIGCRYVDKHNGIQVGILIGILWSIVELYLIFQILSQIPISLNDPVIKERADYFVISMLFASNILFSAIGGYSGGSKFEKAQEKLPITENVGV